VQIPFLHSVTWNASSTIRTSYDSSSYRYILIFNVYLDYSQSLLVLLLAAQNVVNIKISEKIHFIVA
jgi:hypothetical protein